MDELHNSSLSARVSSPKNQPALELGDNVASGGGEGVVQKSVKTENEQIGLTEVSGRQCNSDEILKASDYSINNSSFGSLTPHNPEYSLESANVEPLELRPAVVHEIGKNSSSETGVVASSELPRLKNLEDSNGEQIRLVKEFPTSNSTIADFRLPHENGAISYAFEDLGSASCDASENFSHKKSESAKEDPSLQQSELANKDESLQKSEPAEKDANLQQSEPADKDGSLQQSEPSYKDANSVAGDSGLDKETPVPSRKQKSSLLPPVSNWVLRSRSQEKLKATEPKVVEVEDNNANGGRKRKRRMKAQRKKIPVNEFSRIRTHLRYLLHRIKYEQNLIDAYSGEGWKGQSLEKIKPEKELQRARSHIFRYKLKIRDLLQHLDWSLSQGKLPESLFDSEGQIDSEDIFCAKCGSKDLTLENDIILCDGACERGFHQFCLDPPLSKEDMPPDDEGWLCPGCDCKVDCVAMLNDFQGSTLSVLDNWEKVFPEEAAAAASGKSMDDITRLPSDDSEDDDYNPDDPGLDHQVSGDESSSDKSSSDKSSSDGSDYFSASDDAVPCLDNKQILGLPSDDSEDDDYDPSAPDHNQHAKQESSSSSSSSDFTSDSEDLDSMLEDGGSPGKDEGEVPSVSDQSKPDAVASGERLKAGKAKRQSLRDELSYLMESNAVQVSGKRQVERLDYKKLHDETYGDATSDSSDEDYGETAGPKRQKRSARKAIPTSADEIQSKNDGTDTIDGNQNLKKSGHAVEVGSSGKNATRPYKRLGEAVIQRLVESFKENQYPKQHMKESLAKELGLRVQQVSKWFENARWSFRHSSCMELKLAEAASRNGTSSPRMNEISPEAEKDPSLQSPSCNGVEKVASSQVNPGNEERQMTDAAEGKLVSEASGHRSRKRKSKVDNQESSVENCPVQEWHADTAKNRAVRKSSRLQARGSKSF